jgi:hypothetical protein
LGGEDGSEGKGSNNGPIMGRYFEISYENMLCVCVGTCIGIESQGPHVPNWMYVENCLQTFN